MFVKICGVARPEDALAAADAGASAIGLNFVPESSRCIDDDTARRIIDATASHVTTVGVYRGQTVQQVIESVERLGLHAAQVHGASAADLAAIAANVPFSIVGLEHGNPNVDAVLQSAADVVMLDGPDPGSGVAFDWTTIGTLTKRRRILLAGGLHPGNVADAIRHAEPWGVDVATGVESGPGQKDPAAIARFVSSARRAFATAR